VSGDAREPNADAREQAARVPLLLAERLSKVYPVRRRLFGKPDLVHAVDHVSLYVRHGEIVGVVGESGSGKSTLARLLTRLVEPTLGRVIFDGVDVTRASARALRKLRRRLQILFQDPGASLDPLMSVRAAVGEGLTVQTSLAESAIDERVEQVLGRMGMGLELWDRLPHELSGGQRQRVALARALAIEPELLVCDEPVSALDVSVQAQVLNLLLEERERRRMAIVFVSHDLRVIEFVSDRVVVLYRGRVVEEGPTSRLVRRRHHPYTRALFAAVPTGARRLLAVMPPDTAPSHDLKGCAYAARCPLMEPGLCDSQIPHLVEPFPKSQHRVACFKPVVE
jgi:oligopeptide/dipeptide ABC transporter ATP-binding protein